MDDDDVEDGNAEDEDVEDEDVGDDLRNVLLSKRQKASFCTGPSRQ